MAGIWRNRWQTTFAVFWALNGRNARVAESRADHDAVVRANKNGSDAELRAEKAPVQKWVAETSAESFAEPRAVVRADLSCRVDEFDTLQFVEVSTRDKLKCIGQ